MNSRRQARALSDLILAATSTAASVARLFVDYTLREWDCSQLAPAGRGVTSELVEDAVKQTGIPEPGPRWTDLHDLAVLRLRLVLLDGSVICEVADRHDQPPAPSEEFRSLCKQWNFYPTSVGRVVWAELEIPAYELTSRTYSEIVWGAGALAQVSARMRSKIPQDFRIVTTSQGLPRRKPSPVPRVDRPIVRVTDPDVLSRVRDGLKKL